MFKWFWRCLSFSSRRQAVVSDYQKVAALLAMEIDTLLEIVDAEELEREDLLIHIRYLHRCKEQLLADKELRDRRYSMTQGLLRLGE